MTTQDTEFVPIPNTEFESVMFGALPEGEGPAFTVSEVGKIFFARSPHWMRWIEREGWLTDDDGELMVRRREGSTVRTYGLADVERIAYALADKRRIDAPQLLMALRVMRSVGDVWGLLPAKVKKRQGRGREER